jgi:hypothetical protein
VLLTRRGRESLDSTWPPAWNYLIISILLMRRWPIYCLRSMGILYKSRQIQGCLDMAGPIERPEKSIKTESCKNGLNFNSVVAWRGWSRSRSILRESRMTQSQWKGHFSLSQIQPSLNGLPFLIIRIKYGDFGIGWEGLRYSSTSPVEDYSLVSVGMKTTSRVTRMTNSWFFIEYLESLT